MSTAPETETKPAPWYAAFPEPQSDLMNISRAEVLEMLKGSTGEVVGKDFVLVDLRRNDFEVRDGVHPSPSVQLANAKTFL